MSVLLLAEKRGDDLLLPVMGRDCGRPRPWRWAQGVLRAVGSRPPQSGLSISYSVHLLAWLPFARTVSIYPDSSPGVYDCFLSCRGAALSAVCPDSTSRTELGPELTAA